MNVQLIQRKRLTDKFSSGLNKKIFTIVSPAGYGKTTLIKQIIKKLNLHYVYFVIPELSNLSFSVFIKYFSSRLVSLFNCNSNLEKLINSSFTEQKNNPVSFDEFVFNMVFLINNELKSKSNNIILIVLDDIQNLDNQPWFEIFIKTSFDVFSENIRIVLLSRTKPSFSLIKYESRKQLIQFNLNDLRFTDYETMQLSKTYQLNLDKKIIDSIQKSYKGWVTGLVFYFDEYSRNPNFTAKEKIKSYEYFMEEIFSKLDAEIKQFLLRSCLPDFINEKICTEVFGFSGVKNLISRLMVRNIFIESIDEKNFKYLDLFREFLKSKFNELLPKKEQLKIAEKLAEYYYMKKDINNAIKYYLQAKKFISAYNTLEENLEQLLYQQDFYLLNYFVTHFQEPKNQENPLLSYLQGILEYKFRYNKNLAKTYFLKAINQKPVGRWSKLAQLEYINLLLSDSEISTAIGYINKLSAEILPAKVKREVLFKHGQALVQNFEYKKARKLFTEVRLYCKKDEYFFSILILNIAKSYFLQSKLKEAELALKELPDHNNDTQINLFKSILYRDFKLMMLNTDELDKLTEQIDRLVQPFRSLSISWKKLISDANYMMLGDFEKHYKIMDEIINQRPSKDNKFWCFSTKAHLEYFAGNYEIASDSLLKAKEYLNKKNKYVMCLYNTASSFNCFVDGNIKEAIKILTTVMNVYKNSEMTTGILLSQMLMTKYYIKNGNKIKAIKVLKNMIELNRTISIDFIFVISLIYFREIIDLWIEEKIEPEFNTNIYNHLQNILLLNSISEEYRIRLPRLIKNTIDIDLNLLGKFDLKIRGKSVAEAAWKYKKWKNIFVYFLVNAETGVTKDTIKDLLYNGKTNKSIDNKFHQLISNFRQILKPKIDYEEKTSPDQSFPLPSYLVYKKQLLSLKKGYFYKIDVLDFIELSEKGLKENINFEDMIENLKEAVKLYKGDLFIECYDNWCEDLRQYLSNRYIDVLKKIIQLNFEKNNYADTLLYCEKMLAANPYCELTKRIKNEITLKNKTTIV